MLKIEGAKIEKRSPSQTLPGREDLKKVSNSKIPSNLSNEKLSLGGGWE